MGTAIDRCIPCFLYVNVRVWACFVCIHGDVHMNCMQLQICIFVCMLLDHVSVVSQPTVKSAMPRL